MLEPRHPPSSNDTLHPGRALGATMFVGCVDKYDVWLWRHRETYGRGVTLTEDTGSYTLWRLVDGCLVPTDKYGRHPTVPQDARDAAAKLIELFGGNFLTEDF